MIHIIKRMTVCCTYGFGETSFSGRFERHLQYALCVVIRFEALKWLLFFSSSPGFRLNKVGIGLAWPRILGDRRRLQWEWEERKKGRLFFLASLFRPFYQLTNRRKWKSESCGEWTKNHEPEPSGGGSSNINKKKIRRSCLLRHENSQHDKFNLFFRKRHKSFLVRCWERGKKMECKWHEFFKRKSFLVSREINCGFSWVCNFAAAVFWKGEDGIISNYRL